MKKTIFQIFIIFIICLIFYITYSKYFKKEKIEKNTKNSTNKEKIVNNNVIKNIRYVTEDKNGNSYLITAEEGIIDVKNYNIINLKNVNSIIKNKNNENIEIKSDKAIYNKISLDTKFSSNVELNYLVNNIKAQYLDLDLDNNKVSLYEKVIYNNPETNLIADKVVIDLITKNSKIFMYDPDNKVKGKSKF
ncbi:LPS export ABC transporter periplasmic protein LptC [Candidatus Pelagibacter sp.]|uniref:LPS export ABC transporter periplasmic protein LptC n=1 Tax=Candidatus Pelagibacter sp. TaxID=2024849 RepID=UPI003F84F3EC